MQDWYLDIGGNYKKRGIMELRKERSRWEIIHDILAVAFEERKAKKTHIMQRACLDWRNFQRYYGFLIEENLLANSNLEKDCYELTDKGKDLLNRLEEVDEILNTKSEIITASLKTSIPLAVS